MILAVAGYLISRSFQEAKPVATAPGCQAGTGEQAIYLDADQAAIAATIAGVAARHGLPQQAVIIAYAAALQESQLHNLNYGDRDSVGVFQQRPSQGWGPAQDLENPIYATTKFFDALVRVPDYSTVPVEAAAQAVQHSADGSAYAQWTTVATQLAGYFTGSSPHGVSCWYAPAPKVNLPAKLAAVEQGLTQAFGSPGQKAVLVRITTDRSGHNGDGTSRSCTLSRPEPGWSPAGWSRTLRTTGSAKCGMPVMPGRRRMARWAGKQTTTKKNDPPRGSIVAG